MAAMGAAALRRKGFSTAIVPEEWESARGGVDVVIGARSAVFAPCPDVSAIVVIDEHDESLHDERSPTWDATSVAIERARAAGIPIIATSAVPSADSEVAFAGRRVVVESEAQWPRIEVVNLSDVPVASSLLSSQLFESIATRGSTTVVVLNTKGKARLIVCKSCRAVQSCATCDALLTQDASGELRCDRCSVTCGSVCVSCGRGAFIVPRGGVSQLRSQLQSSSVNPVIEITADSNDEWTKGNVFIGTEAVLHRVPFADCVVFADIDRDLGAPRMSAPHEVLALIARAARTVGVGGKVIVQTRQMEHPLMVALQSLHIADSLRQWAQKDLEQRRVLALPPFGVVARVTVALPRSIDEVTLPDGIQIAREEESVVVRAMSHESMDDALRSIRKELGTAVRIHMSPRRF
jgi:primosomal protein N' (replication factor Y)